MIEPVDAQPRARGESIDDPRGARTAPRGVFGRTARDVVAAGVVLAVAACGSSRRAPRTDDARAPRAIDAAASAGPAVDAAVVVSLDARAVPAGWSDVAVAIPDVVLDLRYATPHNLTGAALYPVARCLLRTPVARRLAEAARALAARGHRLVMWDCYRPASLQAELWRRVPDRRFVAEPVFDADGTPRSGSRHSRGAAVDVSLAALDGAPRAMPTDHDDFGPAASGARATGDAARWLDDLRSAMTAAGFATLASEWWHFDAIDGTAYPLSDEPL